MRNVPWILNKHIEFIHFRNNLKLKIKKEVTYKSSKHNKRRNQSQVEKFLGVLLGMVTEITQNKKPQSVLRKNIQKNVYFQPQKTRIYFPTFNGGCQPQCPGEKPTNLGQQHPKQPEHRRTWHQRSQSSLENPRWFWEGSVGWGWFYPVPQGCQSSK